MLSNLDIIDDVYAILGTSALEVGSGEITGITGGIYKLRRPETSIYEDVVINALPVSYDDVLRCTVNVNIHIPDIRVTIGGRVQEQPNYLRMQVLTSLAVAALEQCKGEDYYLWVENQSIIHEEPAKEHYVNIRIEYRTHRSILS